MAKYSAPAVMPMACTRCGKPAVPGSFRPWRHAALADAIACTIPGGPMTAAPSPLPAQAPERFAQESLFDQAVSRG